MTFVKDVKFGLRGMRKNIGFTIVAVLTLAVAIGANSAIFTIIDAVLLRPLPYDHPEKIAWLWESTDIFLGSVSWPNFLDWSEQNTSFESLAGWTRQNVTLQQSSSPERVVAGVVTSNFFQTLGAQPMLGRTFAQGEDIAGAQKTVVLSEGLWKTRFAADKNIIGRAIPIGGEPHVVIGVMPGWMNFPNTAQLWIPFVPTQAQVSSRGNHFMLVLGRLRPGVTLEQAQQEMKVIAARIAQQYPDSQAKRSIRVVNLQEQMVGTTRPTLIALLAAVGFVLLIACANVANLLLARVTGRRREIAIRIALGASHGQLVRQFLTESVLLAALSGLVGLVIAKISMASLVAWAAPFLPRATEVSLDWRVVVFSMVAAAITGVLCGVVPAMQSWKEDPQNALKQGGTSAGSPQANWLTGVLAVGEVAASVVLLIAAGLMIRSVVKLQDMNPGFETTNVITMKIALPPSSYTAETAPRFYDNVLGRVAALPGVQSVGAITFLPAEQWGWNGGLTVQGVPRFNGEEKSIERRYISEDYFRAMGIPLVKGRFFNKGDTVGKGSAVLINQSLAKLIEPYGDPVGKVVEADTDEDPVVHLTIVGIVGDVNQAGLNVPPRPEIYYPYQTPVAAGTIYDLSLVVRATGDPTAIVNGVRREVAAVDPNQAVYGVKRMQEIVESSFTNFSFTRTLVTVFAILGTLLAVIGVYSVLSYLVSQHTREIGIRMALGAQRFAITRMVLNQALVVGVLGVAIGVGGALALTRLLASMLYGVKAHDPATFAGASALLFTVVLVACYVPAWRATKVDPMVVLRHD
jgi:putative ABC transport system permease protein